MAVPNGKAYIHVCPFYVYISPSSGGRILSLKVKK
jgi:hypothetical protein